MKIIRCIDEAGNVIHACLDSNDNATLLEGNIEDGFRDTAEAVSVKKLLAPLEPKQILCIGLNYKFHAEETGSSLPEYPVLFFKGVSAMQNPGDPIELPRYLRSKKVDYECELAVVIGKACKNVAAKDALDYVFGYTCANDVSARDWQKDFGGGQWCRGKTFDTFAPMGPCLVTADEIGDPNALEIKTLLNGEAVQDWNTNDMIFDVRTLIAFLSGSTTLLPGTVILTGTPHGVGIAAKPPRLLKAGDLVEIEIEKIGRLSNPVIEEAC